ncbi:unnamed protein product [Ectocarpus sp. 12 AP-2014]
MADVWKHDCNIRMLRAAAQRRCKYVQHYHKPKDNKTGRGKDPLCWHRFRIFSLPREGLGGSQQPRPQHRPKTPLPLLGTPKFRWLFDSIVLYVPNKTITNNEQNAQVFHRRRFFFPFPLPPSA